MGAYAYRLLPESARRYTDTSSGFRIAVYSLRSYVNQPPLSSVCWAGSNSFFPQKGVSNFWNRGSLDFPIIGAYEVRKARL